MTGPRSARTPPKPPGSAGWTGRWRGPEEIFPARNRVSVTQPLPAKAGHRVKRSE